MTKVLEYVTNKLLKCWCLLSKCKSVLFISIATIAIFTLLGLSNKDPLMVIEAQSRSLDFVVANNEEARIAFPSHVALKTSPRTKAQCLQGLFEPSTGAKVSYSLIGNTLLIRTSTGRFILADKNVPPIELSERSSISYGALAADTNGACNKETKAVQLPIWGATNVGQTSTPQTLANQNNPFTGTLIGGTVLVFGRNMFDTDNGIYPAGEFALPAGARLSSQASANDHVAPWWGYAKYLPSALDNEISSLEISATTIASSLIMQRRGSGPSSEKIEARVFAQVTGDPICAFVITLLASIFFILEFTVATRELSKDDDE